MVSFLKPFTMLKGKESCPLSGRTSLPIVPGEKSTPTPTLKVKLPPSWGSGRDPVLIAGWETQTVVHTTAAYQLLKLCDLDAYIYMRADNTEPQDL